MKLTLNVLALLCAAIGCGHRSDSKSFMQVSTPMNTIELGGESFAIKKCSIWGYLGKRDGGWYCRWCIDAEAQTRTFLVTEDGETYTNELQPSVSANSMSLDVADWPELDGKIVKTTGDHEDVAFFDNSDQRATFTIRTMTSHELCSNNVISLRHLDGNRFHLRWSADAYIHGLEGDKFVLDCTAEFTGVSLQSEVSNESEVNDEAIRKIFDSVFPNGSFSQQPAKIRRIEEDGILMIDFESKFIPDLG